MSLAMLFYFTEIAFIPHATFSLQTGCGRLQEDSSCSWHKTQRLSNDELMEDPDPRNGKRKTPTRKRAGTGMETGIRTWTGVRTRTGIGPETSTDTRTERSCSEENVRELVK